MLLDRTHLSQAHTALVAITYLAKGLVCDSQSSRLFSKSAGSPRTAARTVPRLAAAGVTDPFNPAPLPRSAWRHYRCTRRDGETARGLTTAGLRGVLGGDVAVFATARKLATLIYRLLRWGGRTWTRGPRLTKSDIRKLVLKVWWQRPKTSAINLRPQPPDPRP
jgi:hypothetical protein